MEVSCVGGVKPTGVVVCVAFVTTVAFVEVMFAIVVKDVVVVG